MNELIEFFVPGVPATAGSKKPFVYKDKFTGKMRASLAPDNKKQKPWMNTVSVFAKQAYSGPLIDGPVAAIYHFNLLRPSGHYNKTGELNKKGRKANFVITKPDLGKLVRAVEDALTGIIWRDDSRVVMSTADKMYVDRDPGVKITIRDIRGLNKYEIC